MIDIEKMHNTVRNLYENCSDIKFSQEELDAMLSLIDRINTDYKRGKVSRSKFQEDEKSFKNKSVVLIKKIDALIGKNVEYIKDIVNQISTEEEEPAGKKTAKKKEEN
ncbi:MAG TPA: hypothetical protein VJH34_01090 [archaeon]|nr:hypothetical protein [archaeon]